MDRTSLACRKRFGNAATTCTKYRSERYWLIIRMATMMHDSEKVAKWLMDYMENAIKTEQT